MDLLFKISCVWTEVFFKVIKCFSKTYEEEIKIGNIDENSELFQ